MKVPMKAIFPTFLHPEHHPGISPPLLLVTLLASVPVVSSKSAHKRDTAVCHLIMLIGRSHGQEASKSDVKRCFRALSKR